MLLNRHFFKPRNVIPHWALHRGFPIAADFSGTESRKDRTHFIHFLRVYLLRVLQLDRSASGAFFGVSVAAPFRLQIRGLCFESFGEKFAAPTTMPSAA